MKTSISIFFLVCMQNVTFGIEYPSKSITLKNGMKVIVCEKPGSDFVQMEVWYRAGSKDEYEGIRGMAHLFEHMMFRGTTRYPNDTLDKITKSVGGRYNAYTSFDRTVYWDYIPKTKLDLFMDIEADRMQNLVVTQEVLNTERQVVGEELRNGLSNWYQKMNSDRYPFLYPEKHPYEVDVIGNLNEIITWTSKQCYDFYNNFYSPNNAFLVVVGNVKPEEVFAMADKYFGSVTKQLNIAQRIAIPTIDTFKVKQNEMIINFPLQIYSYVYPSVPVTHKDFTALQMFNEIVFFSDNSILNTKLVKKEYLAYGINLSGEDWSLYPNMTVIDIIMNASPGNVKVKKAVRKELDRIANEGISQERLNDFVNASERESILSNYQASSIAAELGMYEYYFNDYNLAYDAMKEYKKVSPDDMKRIAATYFSESKLQVINIKPE